MNFAGINFCDTANGKGVRVSLFVSGCSLHCKGCHNKDAWDPNYGKVFNGMIRSTLLEALEEPYIDGLSVLGGEPLEDYNRGAVSDLVASVKHRFHKKTIWLWTGRKFEDIKDLALLKYVDVLITGPFIERKKCDGKYYGSSNQQIYRKSADGTFEVVSADAL